MGGITAPPLEGLLAEFINPWLIILVILLLAGVVILTFIMRSIPTRSSPAQRVTRPQRVRAEPERLKIPSPVRGITLKKAVVIGNYRIVEKIAAVRTGMQKGFRDVPETSVVIKSMKALP